MRCALLQAWVGRTSRRRGHNELREERELKETSKPQPAPHCHRTLRFLLRSPFSHISVGQSVVFISVWGASLVHLISWWALVRPSLFRPSLLEHGIRIASCRPVVFGYIPHQTFSSPLSSPLHPTRAPLLTVFFINLRHHVFSFTIFPSPWLSRIFLDRSLKDGGKRERRMRCAVDSSRTLFSFFFFYPPLCNHAFRRLPPRCPTLHAFTNFIIFQRLCIVNTAAAPIRSKTQVVVVS